ncbi:glycoside hydrolase 5 family protein [Sandarakinorhabdus oryzae]|uniref:cellulase family glycosylhydrolase n=1 Tax=Sandarakinorhabdus oryzae TaxID=2675220 RepID=UPI0012E132B6|nr:cellulase family glycosylhydrolase [Sandarakinorhabdus oryzae]
MGDMQLWSVATAREWQARVGWQVGCNFTPSCAINQIEMWGSASFDLHCIERELDLAGSLGLNALRVYLHDLLWLDDAEGLLQRIDLLLAAAHRRGIRVMLVLFDSCWNETPHLGPQRAPLPGVHNSGWVQSPGPAVLADPSQHGRLQAYVEGVVGRFARDDRVLAWDIWNEPDNGPDVSLCDPASLAAKAALVLPLLNHAFGWARRQRPQQPLTSGVWLGDWSAPHRLSDLQATQVAQSDVISFHNYGDAADFARRITWLQAFDRPLLCTEFMARPTGSTFEAILPIALAQGVGAFCWGLVKGKTQTHLPWDSWNNPYLNGPDGPWFHDIFDADGTPHDEAEVALIRRLTGAGQASHQTAAA